MSASVMRSLVERGLALVVRGKALDRRWAGKRGGSATTLMQAEEAYDDLLAEWERDARKALREALEREGRESAT